MDDSKSKTVIRRNSRFYRNWVDSRRNINNLDEVREVRNATIKLIKEAKYIDLGSKFSDPNTGQKHFGLRTITLLTRYYTNIPPIIDSSVFISNCKIKSDIFHKYFAHQFYTQHNGSVLPNFTAKIHALLSHISVTKNHILNLINNFNSNKTHDCDGIFVSMLNICPAEITTPLQIINF